MSDNVPHEKSYTDEIAKNVTGIHLIFDIVFVKEKLYFIYRYITWTTIPQNGQHTLESQKIGFI